ncbi:MAG: TetR family transcriptional regulator [Chloroflexota bacterium]
MATRGRRPAGSGTREAIIEEGRRQFGERGYRDVTLRSVAQGAGVDPKLVLHYFGSKQGLFSACVQLPVPPEVILGQVFSAPREEMPERAADLIVTVLDDPRVREAFLANLRAAASEPEAAAVIRERLTTLLLLPIAQRVGGERPDLRASMTASQLVGLAMARHVIGLEPVATASSAQLRAAILPVVRHYLLGDWVLPDEPVSTEG